MARPRPSTTGQAGLSYTALDAEKIAITAEALRRRVAERFPGSGLSELAAALAQESWRAIGFAEWLGRPLLWLRILVWVAIALLVGGVVSGVRALSIDLHSLSHLGELLQALESGVNDLVFIGIAIWFLLSIEQRIKRRRALNALHVLRSQAHIVDMHQLTKDPQFAWVTAPDTPSSPPRNMSSAELVRYLDYCSEMLAITSKIAALYAQDFPDPVTLAAVDEIEDLSSALSRKVWQKIMIIDRVLSAEGG